MVLQILRLTYKNSTKGAAHPLILPCSSLTIARDSKKKVTTSRQTQNRFYQLCPAAKEWRKRLQNRRFSSTVCWICRRALSSLHSSRFSTPLSTKHGPGDERRVGSVGSGGRLAGRRDDGNEGMRATLLIRVYLAAELLHSCLHCDAPHATSVPRHVPISFQFNH